MSAGDVTARYSGSASRFGVCACDRSPSTHGERTVVADAAGARSPTEAVDVAHERLDPPFRAEQVGSLLRPPSVHGPRGRGPPARSRAELRGVEDEAIAAAVRTVEASGCAASPTASSAGRGSTSTSCSSSTASAVTGNIAASSTPPTPST
jgi:hypothetical protein